MQDHRVIFRVHAVQRMFERAVSEVDVRTILEQPIMVEEYPEERPYPTRLVLGWAEGRPLHVLIAQPDPSTTVVLTIYEPSRTRQGNRIIDERFLNG